jgi:hypothetical protein
VGNIKFVPERTVIFVHIPKTAGTTLNGIIDWHYRKKDIYTFGIDGSIDDFKNLSESRRSRIRLLRGHVGFGIHEYLPGPSSYFTILREPIDRVISYYWYVRRTPESFWYNLITSNNMSLQDLVESKQDTMLHNGQTRFLCGMKSAHEMGFSQCAERELEIAKKNLRDNFAVVGLAERFDETLILLKRAFGWRMLLYIPLNVSVERSPCEELPKATRDTIVEANLLDIQLYQYAAILFEERVCHQGTSFAQEVKNLQIANRRFGPFMWLYWQARKVSVRAAVRRLFAPSHERMSA